ncbi:oligosaccharide repeat unit polymerase [Aliarcobacter cryaerophilus]|uniref:O-antigen polymerase n=1 Tax=Aliarcobacter cryaerophilus TaxID=28198 RepID=UPI0021B6AB66|nr:O-antigen polymerase [Aliarcobacter cryaerophilus]MCT7471117.1 oligosaccharide repeat unit polymerase [Aliarcobacter cryaerophilus]
MKHADFSILFFENIISALICLLISYILAYMVIRKQVYSIFDPLLFTTIMAASGNAVLFLLYYLDEITSFYFYAILGAQLTFSLGLMTYKRPLNNYSEINSLEIKTGIIKYFYPLSFLIFFISQLVVYIVAGIPLLMESRLETFSGGGGFGILSRLIFVTKITSLSVSIYAIMYRHKIGISYFFHYFVLLFIIITALLSGSKASLIFLIFIISLVMYFSRKFYSNRDMEKRINKYFMLFILMSIPLAMFTISIQSGIEDTNRLLFAIFYRFVTTGDIYYMLLPNDIISLIPSDNGLIALFRDVLGAFRIISWSELPPNLGLWAFQMHYPSIEALSGPNARHNIFGLIYFGWIGSLFFSYTIGLSISYIRNKLYSKLKFNLINMSLYVLLAYCAIFINQDPSGMAVSFLLSTVLVFPMLYVVSYILYYISKSRLQIPPS